MDLNDRDLQIDPASACLEIEDFLRTRLQQLGKAGIILGLSGGLDSTITAYLSARAVGAGKVRLLYLPDRDSKGVHGQHAQLVASQLGIPLETRDLTPILREIGTYKLVSISTLPGQGLRSLAVRLGNRMMGFTSLGAAAKARLHPEADSILAKANAYMMAKHRLRLLLLYEQAEISNLMVVGAANKTELMTGTFCQWGCDHGADVMPLLHLYRSQLHPIARYLNIPAAILEKPADADILPGARDKEAEVGPYAQIDPILSGLERGATREQLIQTCGAEVVDLVISLVELSRPARESPYTIRTNPSRS